MHKILRLCAAGAHHAVDGRRSWAVYLEALHVLRLCRRPCRKLYGGLVLLRDKCEVIC